VQLALSGTVARGAPRVVVGDTAQPAGKIPQREACLAGGYIATRLVDGNSMRFKKMKQVILENNAWPVTATRASY
jgi:hypothetical protein